MQKWIWQRKNWTEFRWQDGLILPKSRLIHKKMGVILGQSQCTLDIENWFIENLVMELGASFAIENESLNGSLLYASLAESFEIKGGQSCRKDTYYENLGNLIFDLLNNTELPLTFERLMQWHQWLFSTPQGKRQDLHIGELRRPGTIMQVVSGSADYLNIHFEAPPRNGLEEQLKAFIEWFNDSRTDVLLDPLLRAAITHLWFVTMHPFEDGNGRMTRLLTHLALAQVDPSSIRCYAMSPIIFARRESYYEILERSQKGHTDITGWLVWFLDTLDESLEATLKHIQPVLLKNQFWQKNANLDLHESQREVLDYLIDKSAKGHESEVSAAEYQKIAKVSKATATRHLTDLLKKGCLIKQESRGRSTCYQISYK